MFDRLKCHTFLCLSAEVGIVQSRTLFEIQANEDTEGIEIRKCRSKFSKVSVNASNLDRKLLSVDNDRSDPPFARPR